MRIFKVLILLLLANSSLFGAEEFTHIDLSTLGADNTAPYYNETFDLGESYAIYNYSVSLEYPVYEELTLEEKKRIDALALVLTDNAQIYYTMGVERKIGRLDVSILPIAKRDGKLLKLTSCKINISKNAVNNARSFRSSSATAYAENSVLSSGKWAKIRVSTDGVYQLTAAALKQMGFSDMSKVKVYGYGGQILDAKLGSAYPTTDDLEEVPLYRRSGSLLFFANGTVKWSDWAYQNSSYGYMSTHTNNHYSSYSYYFVTEGDSPMDFPSDPSVSSDLAVSTETSFPERVVLDNDAYSWYSGGTQFYDSYDFASGNQHSFSLATPDADLSAGKASATISFTAGNAASTSVSVSLNGSSIGSFLVSAKTTYAHAMQTSQRYSLTSLSDNNTFTFTTTSGRSARLDYIRLNYMRKLNLSSTSLLFSHYQTGVVNFQLSGANSSTHLWRIGTPGSPTSEVQGTLSGSVLTATVSDATQRFVAVDVSASFPQPTFVSSVANQNLHASETVDMVIIVPQTNIFHSQAQRLAEYHTAKQGLRVKVVRADEIYNEFSSGTPDATAYRRYMKMLYDRASSDADMPRYLMLFGDCAWDNRMLTSAWKGYEPNNFLLSYESGNSLDEVECYVTDDYFGLLDDGEGSSIQTEKIDLGIGRFPVRTLAQATTLVDKVISYMNNDNPGDWKNTICMMADDGNSNQHMTDAETVAGRIETSSPELMVKRVYWDAYKRETTASGNTYPEVETILKKQMDRGALIMNYCGHGAAYQISHEQVLKLADFKKFSSPKLPLWVAASCEITPFDTQEETIGEESMYNTKGGTIGVFSAARAVYSTPNRYINSYFMKFVLGTDESGNRYTIGDAMRLTKTSLISPPSGETMTDISTNKLKYALMGDPALVLSMPTYRVVVDSLNGEYIDSQNQQSLKAGSVARISGHIEDTSGSRVPSFTGTVKATLLDAEETITCKNNNNEDITPFTYTERTKTLYEGSDSVRTGSFTLELPVPLDITYSNRSGRLNFYAVSSDNQKEGNGSCTKFLIGGTAENIENDSTGPKMFVYLNTPEFQDGGRVNETPYFVAQLSDDEGINAAGNGVGHDIELIIDGKEETSYVLNSYFENDFGSYTSGKVYFSIPELEEGSHRLYFRAWDVKNNSSSTSLNFYVQKGAQPSLLNVVCTANPASTSTTFIISYDRPKADASFSISVYDTYGRQVWQHSESGSSSSGYYNINWNLTSLSGARLPSGLYLFKAGVAVEGSKESTQTKKIIIINNK